MEHFASTLFLYTIQINKEPYKLSHKNCSVYLKIKSNCIFMEEKMVLAEIKKPGCLAFLSLLPLYL